VGSGPSVASPPSAATELAALRRLERAENFPVALRVLPPALRADLRAVYDVARFIDDVGDDPSQSPQQRLRRLATVADDVVAAFTGSARLEVMARLQPTIARRRLVADPFLALVEANRRDQLTSRYASFDELRDYCRLSADPVGRIVLAVFGVDDAETRRLSDLVCTALQILEHCQDVAEDRRDRDRVYLPQEDLASFGVVDADLLATAAAPAVRRLIAFEVDRAAALLDEGAAIVERLHGWARLAVAGYVAGGRATVDAIHDADCDVLATTPRPRGRQVARHLLGQLRSPR